MRAILSGAAVLIFAASAGAQPRPDAAELPALRYELGKRLKRFETAWEKHERPESRRLALGHVEKLTQQFFAFQFGEAGRSLDRAAFALLSDDEPSTTRQWAWSLYATPEARVIDGSAKELTITVKQLYAVKGDMPKGLEVQLWFTDKQVTTLKPDKFPLTVKVPLPPLGEFAGLDRKLYFMVEAGKELRHTAIGVSQVANLKERVAALKKAVAAWPAVDSIEKATARDRAELLADLASGAAPETDFPAADLLANAEAMLDGKPFYTAAKQGQFWLSVPTTAKSATAVRMFVPRGLEVAGGGTGEPAGGSPSKKKPVPVVVALHGAGGSENLFFEGYGAGHIVSECRKRGWLLVAPRSGFGLSGPPPVSALLDELAKRYPIDPKRVFVVGHSMGAIHTLDLVQKHSGKFAAVALLGGAASVRDVKAFAELPTFVGVGEKDALMLNGVRGLNKALMGTAKKLTYQEYPHVEHMVIVREALPDVFAVFDGAAK
jgi:predicted esterase